MMSISHFIKCDLKQKILHQKLGVTIRTIYSDLDSPELNKIIYPGFIEKKTNKGIRIQIDPITKKNKLYELEKKKFTNIDSFNTDEKIKLLLLLVTEKKISYEKIKRELFISSHQIDDYISDIDTFISKYNSHCSLKTISRECFGGKEYDIIFSLSKYILSLLNDSIDKDKSNISINKFIEALHATHPLEFIDDLIQVSEKLLNNEYTEEDKILLKIFLAIKITRLKQSYHSASLESFDHESIEYLIANILLEKINLPFDKHDIVDLSKIIMSTRKQKSVMYSEGNNNDTVIVLFLSSIEKHLGMDFSNDVEFVKNLTDHLLPAIRRIKHGTTSNNLIIEKIKRDYSDIYITTMLTLESIEEKLNITFDENEIGFICLHLITAINKKKSEKDLNTVLICNSGLSFKIYLKSIIETKFPNLRIEKIYASSETNSALLSKYDLVLNTCNFSLNIPKEINISTSLSQTDIQKIKTFCSSFNKNKMERYFNLFRNNLFLFHSEGVNTDVEIIKQHCEMLEKINFINNNYVDGVIRRIKTSGTYIGNNIAVIHGFAKDAIKPAMVIINLSKNIKWDNDTVNLIFLIVVTNDENQDYPYFFRDIIKLTTDPEKIKSLKKSKDISEIMKLL